MKHVYFFRHGETVLNARQILQGHTAFPELNEKGIEQAKTIVQKLKDIPLQVIYSSPLKRARQTADIVNTQFDVPIIEDDYLKEMLEFPEYYGKNLDALYDCLTDLADVEITITVPEEDGAIFQKVLRVFKSADRENENLKLIF